MLVVTGANGRYGRLVVECLRRGVPAGELAVSVRDPAAAADLTDEGIRVRRGDFDDPGSLAVAFEGATTVLINGTNYGTDPDVRGRQQADAIAAAVAAGARRIVVTSWVDLDNCRLRLATDYPRTERLVAASGVAWTVLRLTFGLPAALARDVSSALAVGELIAPAGAARVSVAADADLAGATAAVLTQSGHEGRVYELTGPDAIDWDDLAGLAGALAGVPIRYRPVSDEEFTGAVLSQGFPSAAVEGLLEYYAALRSGWAATPRSDMAGLLGRPATPSLKAVRAAIRR